MTEQRDSKILQALERASSQIVGATNDYDPLMELIGDARFVLLGASTCGTHEFCAAPARITRRLIEEKGFTAVALDADWPDVLRVNRYVQGSGDRNAVQALDDFYHFPTWEWRNAAVLDFVEWLHDYNASHGTTIRVHGLDFYNLHASSELVIADLDQVDPAAARRMRHRCAYPCFDEFGADARAYGHTSSLGIDAACEDELVERLVELRNRSSGFVMANRQITPPALFGVELWATLSRDAPTYYRGLLGDRALSWNLRNRHLAVVLEELAAYLERSTGGGKVVVWAHNTQVGDARATELCDRGEVSLGQIIRERHGSDVVLVGLSTYYGTVTAASEWGGPVEQGALPAAVPDSFEALFHDVTHPRFLLSLRQGGELTELLGQARRQRALGIVYRPAIEPRNHYIHGRCANNLMS